MRKLFPFVCVFACLSAAHSFAGSATWSATPVDSNWYNPANWTPQTVPNGPDDVATFATSNITEVTFHNTGGYSIEVNAIVFDPGASPFSINPTGRSITVSGAGVINNSGIT